MKIEMKQSILKRWQSLHEGDGVRHARRVAMILRVVSSLAFVAVFAGIATGFHPALVALLAAVMGWLIAESNALRLRLTQWPIMEDYIDWARVRADSSTEPDENDNRGPQPGVGR